jgi:hypothetical protein
VRLSPVLPRQSYYEPISPLFNSVDVFLPIHSLHQEDYWLPKAESRRFAWPSEFSSFVSWGWWLRRLALDRDHCVRAGFANTESLLSAAKKFTVPRLGKLTDRVMLLNIFDRTNLIRPANGIGVIQSAYGPRISVNKAVTIPLFQ